MSSPVYLLLPSRGGTREFLAKILWGPPTCKPIYFMVD
jgi:hypothetical protein